MVWEVCIPDAQYRYASKERIASVCRALPRLPYHTCKNDEGPTFAAVMDHTSIPHVLEHAVIELQAQNAVSPTTLFVGTTVWLDESEGRARIEVGFADDLDALRAFRAAIQIIDAAMI